MDSKTPVMIIGTGSEARIALDAANALDVLVYGFLATEEEMLNKELNDILVISKLGKQDSDTLLQDENMKLVIAVKDLEKRHDVIEHLEDKKPEIINAIHPFNSISPTIKLGRGNLFYPGVIIHPNAMIGSFNLIESQVSIGADTQIGDYCTIQAGVKIGDNVMIQNDVRISMGAIIHPGVSIGKESIIGPGALVLTDVDEGDMVIGNPAKSVS